MKKLSGTALLLFLAGCASWPKLEPRPEAEWTVMLYFNGDNNLEDEIVKDFREAAEVEGSDKVNVVVLFDRAGRPLTTPNWDETYLFLVEHGKEPIPENAIARRPVGELNLGSGRVVSKFVRWSRDHFPARRYALILSSHGSGPRLFHFAPGKSARIRDDIPKPSYKAFSPDNSSRDHLYVREFADALRHALREDDDDLALVGFDACLMAMTENAYALRDVAQFFVGSEELEPVSGWCYREWLKLLMAKPDATAVELGQMIVAGYKADALAVGDRKRTLSVIDLKGVVRAEKALSTLADTLIAAPSEVWTAIAAARKDECEPYGCGGGFCFNHVDVRRFVSLLTTVSNSEVAARAAEAEKALDAPVIDNYAGPDREGGKFGSHGLAIYFPLNRELYNSDPYQEHGYERWNLRYPLEFVEDSRWPEFLQTYFRRLEH